MSFILICIILTSPIQSFSFGDVTAGKWNRGHVGFNNAAVLKSIVSNNGEAYEAVDDTSRRKVFSRTVLVGAFLWPQIGDGSIAKALVVEATAENPVVVIGGGGRTGMEVAQELAKEGLYAVTMTRDGRDPFQIIKLPPDIKSHIAHYPDSVNVRQADNLLKALDNVHASAIIFCASASSRGGSAFEVDDEGAGNAAQAALSINARLVLISALAVDKPESKSYKVTNSLGGNLDKIMDAKLNGENRVRSILKKTMNYVIIRPGPLVSKKMNNGASDIEINQGDMVGGGISRSELAGVTVGALMSGKRGVTVEVYRTSTRTKLQPEFDKYSGMEATSDKYVGLFKNVKPDT